MKRHNVPRALETQIKMLPVHYLGAAIDKGSALSQYWQLVIEKVERRLEEWQIRVLLRGGECLVLSLIPTFFISCTGS